LLAAKFKEPHRVGAGTNPAPQMTILADELLIMHHNPVG
jgi:hypothetical protein